MPPFQTLLRIFFVAVLATSTLAGVVQSPRSERCGLCEAKQTPLSVIIPQLQDRITPKIDEMKNLPSDKITPEALGPIAKDITNAIHEVTDQIQLFIDQNVDLDILLADKPGGSQRLRLAEIGVTVAGLVSVIVGGITAVLKAAGSGNAEAVIQVLLEIVVALVTLLLRLGTLLVGLLTTLIPMIPELVSLGLQMGIKEILELIGQ
ncbi:hypothetical protein VNI00_006790 [Paramarasmius palmivorus]|uniref:Uncharacterized protein n=1 Tax=Paramarasmius palmivorus TaxID=297713 RepID=A0AAW0D6Q8_9AGAR